MMEFSELLKQSNGLCCLSPDGKFMATAVQYRLLVRDFKTLQIINLFTNLDAIQDVKWSPDSQFVMCLMKKRGLIQVWSLEEPEWNCKIDEGSAGLVDAIWSPESRHVLTTSMFHLRMTVWSLIDKSVSYIKYPKECGSQGVVFSRDSKLMALAERRNCKDCVSVFACQSWQLLKHFECDTDDMAGVIFSPDGELLCVWENSLSYKAILYTLDGRKLGVYSAYEHALGIKSLDWSPTGQFLAIGSYDQSVRLLNHMTWSCITTFHHETRIERGGDTSRKLVVYQEVEEVRKAVQNERFPEAPFFNTMTKYELCKDQTISLMDIKPDPKKANPKVGPSMVHFSSDSRYLATRNDNTPNALWIWDVERIRLTNLVVNISPIKCVRWDPSQSRLAFCTGNQKVYMWSPAGSLVVQVPVDAEFTVQTLGWHPNGNALLLLGKDQMCVCYLD